MKSFDEEFNDIIRFSYDEEKIEEAKALAHKAIAENKEFALLFLNDKTKEGQTLFVFAKENLNIKTFIQGLARAISILAQEFRI